MRKKSRLPTCSKKLQLPQVFSQLEELLCECSDMRENCWVLDLIAGVKAAGEELVLIQLPLLAGGYIGTVIFWCCNLKKGGIGIGDTGVIDYSGEMLCTLFHALVGQVIHMGLTLKNASYPT